MVIYTGQVSYHGRYQLEILTENQDRKDTKVARIWVTFFYALTSQQKPIMKISGYGEQLKS